jgi:t-SNARE complex subunit (syntaxin)
MNFTLQLFQKECVGGKVLAEEYEIFMTDETGNEVTEIRKAHADMTIENETARTRRLQFSLKAGRTYSSSQIYYLVCRSKSTGIESWKQQFTIDIPFAPLDDFGF